MVFVEVQKRYYQKSIRDGNIFYGTDRFVMISSACQEIHKKIQS